MQGPSPESVWNRLEPLLPRVERPTRYVDSEWNAVHDPDAAYRAALVYPDTYELGMANQALGILYQALNNVPDVVAERCFVPWKDMADLLREEAIPLFTLESTRPLSSCDLVGITLPYELTYSNVLEILDLAGIPLRSTNRGAEDPVVLGGGPCAFNPEPVAPFFDAILLGDGEEAILDIVAAHREAIARGASRAETLETLSGIDGVYVPSLYAPDPDGPGVVPTGDAPATVAKRVVADLGSTGVATCPVVPYMDVVHDRATVEILRGCTRGCRFCQAGMVYRPVRERSADEIVGSVMRAIACTGYEEVSLSSLSSADHSQIEDVARRLKHRLSDRAVTISLPSSRVDAFGVELARLISTGRKGTLTFAPEAGTQRLRDVINKNVSEEDLLDIVAQVAAAGWNRLKLYFMIGLPTETDEDIREIGRLAGEALRVAREAVEPGDRGGIRINVSVSTFVPKSHTPFQWEPQIDRDEMVRRQRILREATPRKGIKLAWHDADVSVLEGAMARGGRELADVVEAAWRCGGRFAAWTEELDIEVWHQAFADAGVDTASIIAGAPPGGRLPWSHLSAGLEERFLLRERDRALAGTVTEDCTQGACSSCGVCPGFDVDNVVQGTRS